MRYIKKALIVILSVLMVFTVGAVTSFAETTTEPTTEKVEPEVAWYATYGTQLSKRSEGTFAEALEKAYAGDTIVLKKDIEITETINVTKNMVITSIVDDTVSKLGTIYTIKRNSDMGGSMFNVAEGKSLTLRYINIDGNSGNTTVKTDSIIKLNGANLTLGNKAVLTNNSANSFQGGAISANSGMDSAGVPAATITMNDGAVISSCSANFGGGVFLFANSTMTMNGGEIKDCKALADAGAVDIGRSGSKFVMTGGSITGCECSTGATTGGWGGAISAEMGTLEISGGKITGNENPDGLGGAIFLSYDVSSCKIGGTAYIYGNTTDKKNNNIFIQYDSGSAKEAVFSVDPAFELGAKIGITTEKSYKDGDQIGFINYTNDITGYVYDDVQGLTYYISNGRIILLECVTITFDPGNGECSYTTKIYPVDVPFGELPEVADRGEDFTFDGWYDAADNKITADSPCAYYKDTTIYAKWTNNNALDMNIWARIGRFFQRIGEMMKIAFDFLANMFTGTGDGALSKLK